MATSAPHVVKSAARVLTVLEYLREHRSGAVCDISSSLGWPQSSTSVLLQSLVTLGYLSYMPGSRRFRPTYRVALLGEGVQKSTFGSGPLTHIMEELQSETGETVVLGQKNGPFIQYIHVIDAMQNLQLSVRIGETRPMAYVALGWALMVDMPAAAVRAIARHNNASSIPIARRMTEIELLDELIVVKKQGFADSRGVMTTGASTIAVAIGRHAGSDLLAIGVGGPIERITENRQRIVHALRDAQRQAIRLQEHAE